MATEQKELFKPLIGTEDPRTISKDEAAEEDPDDRRTMIVRRSFLHTGDTRSFL
jgi:hypothetical protein